MQEIFKKKNSQQLETFKNDIRLFAEDNKLKFQEASDSEFTWICQLRKNSKLTFGVASSAITIIVEDFSEDTIKIRLGKGKWMSKLAGSAATVLIPGPLLFVAGAATVTGISKQMTLSKQINNFIDIHFK